MSFPSKAGEEWISCKVLPLYSSAAQGFSWINRVQPSRTVFPRFTSEFQGNLLAIPVYGQSMIQTPSVTYPFWPQVLSTTTAYHCSDFEIEHTIDGLRWLDEGYIEGPKCAVKSRRQRRPNLQCKSTTDRFEQDKRIFFF